MKLQEVRLVVGRQGDCNGTRRVGESAVALTYGVDRLCHLGTMRQVCPNDHVVDEVVVGVTLTGPDNLPRKISNGRNGCCCSWFNYTIRWTLDKQTFKEHSERSGLSRRIRW